ncbi:MAG TPA: hypothetical protein VMU45_03185 [Candidatus Eisenbacteria bacterium]|nr:hypothetical protein [Candidatus Eisenbacteria bacterium]
MTAFLIIASSSLVFYVGLLVALHLDGRKRHAAAGPIRKLSLGTVAELGDVPPTAGASFAAHRRNSTAVLGRFADTTRRAKSKSQVAFSEPAEVITLPKLARGEDDRQCG